jgi:predicted permease
MRPLRDWSFARVVLTCIGWVGCCIALIALWLFLAFRAVSDAGSGSGGIGAVSVGVNELVLAIPVAPPVVLLVAWLIVRRRR